MCLEQLTFSNDQETVFENALDLVFTKGYTQEIKFQPQKLVGDRLIQYSIMRRDQNLPNSVFGDIMVKIEIYQGKFGVGFFRAANTSIGEQGLQQIPFSKIKQLSDFTG